MQQAREVRVMGLRKTAGSLSTTFHVDYRSILGEDREIELCLMNDDAGNVVALDAVYLENEVAPVTCPYGNGTLVIDGDKFCDGAYLAPDVLAAEYGDAGCPEFPVLAWRECAADGNTLLGYWEWVSKSIKEKEGGVTFTAC